MRVVFTNWTADDNTMCVSLQFYGEPTGGKKCNLSMTPTTPTTPTYTPSISI